MPLSVDQCGYPCGDGPGPGVRHVTFGFDLGHSGHLHPNRSPTRGAAALEVSLDTEPLPGELTDQTADDDRAVIRTANPRIRAIGIVVPARDEEAHIQRCLRGLASALEQSPRGLACAVCLVLDRCTDRTPELALSELARLHIRGTALPVQVLYNDRRATVGALRDAGLRRALRRLPEGPAAATWLLSTDADTTVEPGWVVDHIRHADAGADAVAGLADLDDPDSLGPHGRRRYAGILAAGMHDDRHTHVYGANLGVRADAYLDVGGFPSVATGEDQQLLARLRAAGHRIATPTDVRVRTSSRLHGRATGGLAELLRGLPMTAESITAESITAEPVPAPAT